MRFFGTDGIRDLAGEGSLTRENVIRAGRALGRFAAESAASPRVAIGRDPRPSGVTLLGLLASALTDVGCEVTDLGVVPTPVVPWALASLGFDLGIAISASHNPPAWNGIKPFQRGGRKLTVAEEARLEDLMGADQGDEPGFAEALPFDGAGSYAEATVRALESTRLDGRRLVVDLAAGAASTTAPAVLRGLGADVVLLHEAGTRDINDACGTEHPEAWLEALVRADADAGLAFDGDADRVLLAAPDGTLLDGGDALTILAEDAMARGALAVPVAVSTVMANLGIEERLAALGVALERTPVGDRNVAERMRETGAAIGAEPSGHVVLERDGTLIGDGLVAGVRVLGAALALGRPLAVLQAATPRYPQILRNVRVKERLPLAEMPALAGAIGAVEAALGERGRVVVRYSGTEKLLRIMVEGKDADEVAASVRRIEEAAATARA